MPYLSATCTSHPFLGHLSYSLAKRLAFAGVYTPQILMLQHPPVIVVECAVFFVVSELSGVEVARV